MVCKHFRESFNQESLPSSLHEHCAAPDSLVEEGLTRKTLDITVFWVFKITCEDRSIFPKLFLVSQISDVKLSCTYGFHYKARDIPPVARHESSIEKI